MTDTTPPLRHDEILQTMQEVAPRGQQYLANSTIQSLRTLARQLIDIAGHEAEAEFERFIGVTERGLHLPEDRVQETIRDKNILVTGGTGCIGSALVRQLVKYNPTNITSLSRGISLPRQTTEGVDYQHADIRDSDTMRDTIGRTRPDIIYHLAAQHDPSLAEAEVNRTLTTNIYGTRNILAAAQSANVSQIVYASTGKTIRPFTTDSYASSKKVGEWLMADASGQSDMSISGVRFTHVVDNSIIFRRLQHWIDTDSPIRLHGTNILFYMQSAREAAHLLLNSTMESKPDTFKLQAIRDLEWPVNLVDLAVGALKKHVADTPIYIAGYEQGYEEVSYPAIYDPMYSGELSPLINAFEAPDAEHSATCPEVDAFLFRVETTPELREQFGVLEEACVANRPMAQLHRLKDDLSWKMLDARLAAVQASSLRRVITLMQQYPDYEGLPAEHRRTTEAAQRALLAREA